MDAKHDDTESLTAGWHGVLQLLFRELLPSQGKYAPIQTDACSFPTSIDLCCTTSLYAVVAALRYDAMSCSHPCQITSSKCPLTLHNVAIAPNDD